MSDRHVWFITGCSTGLGRAIAKEALLAKAKVAITARDIATIQDFKNDFPKNTLLFPLDVTDAEQIKFAVAETKKIFGGIDVLVNNAGYGVTGAIEEVPLHEVRKIFDTNFFGLLAVTREILPLMRKQKSGYIFHISSIAGLIGTAGLGIYNATKFAVEGLAEALSLEVAPLGIHVILIEPGPFRTDFAGRSLHTFSEIADYDITRGATQKIIQERSGKQPGDPQKAAKIIVALANHPSPPLHLPLGKIAMDRINAKMTDLSATIAEWEKMILDADFDLNQNIQIG